MINRAFRISALIAFGAVSFQAQSSPTPALTGFPFTDEDLNYSVNWPSGINLGEAHMHAKRAGANWSFAFTVDAGIPGFQVKDTYTSQATADFCSNSFDRSIVHGPRTTQETETIDRSRAIASRVTKGGGQSNVQIPDCVKDALTFLFYTREELGQGRVPSTQQILLGGLYQISLVYGGAPVIPIGEKQVQSDQILCTVKGSSSASFTFEAYFARDPARSPLLIKVPFALGTFSMELIR